MTKHIIDVVIIAIVVFIISLPLLWMTATLTTCGWKGLFVECRIVECEK